MSDNLLSDRLLNASDIALLIKKSVLTIRKDVHRRPDTLPPRTILPGDARSLVWRQSDYEKWIASLPTASKATEETKRGPGRPPIYQQIADQKRQETEPTAGVVLPKEERQRSKGGRPRKADQHAARRG